MMRGDRTDVPAKAVDCFARLLLFSSRRERITWDGTNHRLPSMDYALGGKRHEDYQDGDRYRKRDEENQQ
jgi:hypothetical protein